MSYSRHSFTALCTLASALAAAPLAAQTVELTQTSDLVRLCEISHPVEAQFPALCDGALARVRDEAWHAHSPDEAAAEPRADADDAHLTSSAGARPGAREGAQAGEVLQEGTQRRETQSGDAHYRETTHRQTQQLQTQHRDALYRETPYAEREQDHTLRGLRAPERLPEEAPAELGGEDPVLAAMRARDYARLRAATLFGDYEVVVSAEAFPVWTWDAGTASLVALVDEDVAVFEGAYALDFADAHSISFPMEEADVDDALAALSVGALSVRLNFSLEAQDSPWTEVCSVADTRTRIAVRVVSAQLEESWVEAPTARALTVAYAEARVREVAERSGVVSRAAPRVELTAMEVTSTEATGGGAATPAEQSILQASIEGVFTECYVTGLSRNASLQGALVLAFSVDEDGRAHDPEIQIDALNDLWVTDCALASLDRMTVPLSKDTAEFDVRASVRFSRQE